jgi:3-oxoacyl-[acyl-carrier protein] reductase
MQVRAIAVSGSVTEEGFAERFVGAAINDLGGLDIIVNNAGYTWDSTIGKTTDAQFQAMLDVHVVAPFRILRAASGPIRAMAKGEAESGRIVHRKVVNVSSIAGLFGNVGQVGYSSAKAAITGMTRTMAREWGRYNVNVNAVAFGLIETRLTKAVEGEHTINVSGNEIKVGVHPDLMKSWQKMIPLGRAGTPEDAADAVYLLCAPESNYISGQVVVCAGGLLM